MPLFVKCTKTPTFTQFKQKDYPIAFDTTYGKIHIPNYEYTSEIGGIKITYSFDCRTVNTSPYNPISAYSYTYKKNLNNEYEKSYDEITIYHDLKDAPNWNGSSSGYLITKINTDGYGHISSYKITSAGIKDIWKGSQSSWNGLTKDSNTLYLITS